VTGPVDPSVLGGTSWKAVLVGGQPPVAGREPTASFTPDRVQGTTGCNQYGGSYTQTGDAIEFRAMMMTLMACEDDVSIVEGRFNAAMNGATTAFMDSTGRLIIDGTDGAVTFEAVVEAS
jgi:heat shock protein HslJ